VAVMRRSAQPVSEFLFAWRHPHTLYTDTHNISARIRIHIEYYVYSIYAYGTFAKLLDLVFPSKTNGPAKNSISVDPDKLCFSSRTVYIHTKTYIYMYVCVCVCVCTIYGVRYYFGCPFPKRLVVTHPLPSHDPFDQIDAKRSFI
jgi:hypothetical protein